MLECDKQKEEQCPDLAGLPELEGERERELALVLVPARNTFQSKTRG